MSILKTLIDLRQARVEYERTMIAILRTIVCVVIGSSLGLLFISLGNTEQGIGIAIIGGALGLIISV